ncbi:hypothetical protein K8U54_17990 [Pseudomonas fulva]|uniref:hypothetical protein n=1 Tax=Pseudomonas fulva TaxID=47880 RepID=UPI00201E5E3B|nr:hypothetical protein [Pseudomonas fulva]UQY33593.1 hypothetical protein K8U54_17990 [Pseudomonas fulva]
MSRAAELSTAIMERLSSIKPADGFNTQIDRVYGFGDVKPERAQPPYLLVRIAGDSLKEMAGTVASREVTYEIEGVLGRDASLQDLQHLHYDVLVTLGTGQLPHISPLKTGRPFEESAEFTPDVNGSNARSFVSSVTLVYVERY